MTIFHSLTKRGKLPIGKHPRRSFPTVLQLFWILLLFVAIRGGYYLLSDGFSLFKIQNSFPVTAEWQLPAPSDKEQILLQEICKEPFTYLGKGSQVYAFVSSDKQYVLKLFKCYHLSPVEWLSKLPLPEPLNRLRNQAIEKRYKKIRETLHSYKIASTLLREECGLVALEILPTPAFHQTVVIKDKLGRSHTIDLGSVGFIVQRRADLVYPKLSHWIASRDLSQAKCAIRSLLDLIVRRSLKGIQDSDPDLHKNAGLIGTQAVLIDMGSLHLNEAARSRTVYVADLYKITNRLYQWLQTQSPELATYLHQQIHEFEQGPNRE